MEKRTLHRLFLAASISVGCFGATSFWYQTTKISNQHGQNQKPVAFAERTQEEIHRRPVTRLLWQLVNNGEPLYPGEAIRTSPGGEVRIQFADSDKYIDLEPDSLIVISQSKNEISLDLMDGSFMVAQNARKYETDEVGSDKKSGAPTLTLNSANGKVDLSKATASLSKSSTGTIDLQVLKGSATVESNGQTKEVETGKSGALTSTGLDFNQENLKIISPAIENANYISVEAQQPIRFEWKGFPEGSLVSLEVGANRKELKKVSEVKGTTAALALPLGKHYWRLTAIDQQTKKPIGESPVYRLELAPRYAPTGTAPASNALIEMADEKTTVDFKWNTPEDATQVLLEVSKDPGFKEKLVTQAFKNKEANFAQTLPASDYYWRLGAAYAGLEQPVFGKPQQFSVAAAKPKVTIGWLNADDSKPQYFIFQPEAKLDWSSEQKNQVKSWRLKLAENASDIQSSSAQVFETKDSSLQTKIKKPGRYIAMVEAIDDKNRVIASSPMKTIEITQLPLISSPKILPETGDLKATNEGKLDLKWSPVSGAKEYEVALIDANGKELTKRKSTQASAGYPLMPILFPGKYQVRVTAIDEHGRPSEKPETRTVQVPEGSGLSAPKLKKIKVN